MAEVRRHVAKRRKDKTAFVVTRVRQNQPGRLPAQSTERDDVEVQRPGAPPNAAATPEGLFDPLKGRQENVGRERRLDDGDAIEVSPLTIRSTDGSSFVQPGYRSHRHTLDGKQRAQRFLDGNAAASEIGSEGDVGSGHVPVIIGIDGEPCAPRRKKSKNILDVKWSLGYCKRA